MTGASTGLRILAHLNNKNTRNAMTGFNRHLGMLFSVVVRRASRASFTLRPINFKHSPLSPSNKDVPVITVPSDPKERRKQDHDMNRKRRGKQQISRSSNSRLASFKKDVLASESFDSEELDNNTPTPKIFRSRNKNKFNVKNGNLLMQENLRHLGFSVSGEIIYGIFPVLLALQAKRRKFHHLIYKNGSGSVNENIQNILNIAGEEGIQLTSLKPTQFNKIFQGDQVHQGVCCDVSPLPFVPLENLERKKHEENSHQEPKEKRRQLWLYLDQIHDPMNFGSVLRSSYFMGVDRVITSETCSVGITSTVSKASAGVAEFFPVHQVKDPVELVSSLSHDWDVVSSASPGGGDSTITTLTDVTSFSPKNNVLLIVGNEGKGISPELRQMCHTVLTIEPGRSLHPHLQCLNVSVATALLLHTLRQRLTLFKPQAV